MDLTALIAIIGKFVAAALSGVRSDRTDYSAEIETVEREILALQSAAAQYDAADQVELDNAVPRAE